MPVDVLFHWRVEKCRTQIYTWTYVNSNKHTRSQMYTHTYTHKDLCSQVTLVGESSWHLSTFMTEWTNTVGLLISRVEESHYKLTWTHTHNINTHTHTHAQWQNHTSRNDGGPESLMHCSLKKHMQIGRNTSTLRKISSLLLTADFNDSPTTSTTCAHTDQSVRARTPSYSANCWGQKWQRVRLLQNAEWPMRQKH